MTRGTEGLAVHRRATSETNARGPTGNGHDEEQIAVFLAIPKARTDACGMSTEDHQDAAESKRQLELKRVVERLLDVHSAEDARRRGLSPREARREVVQRWKACGPPKAIGSILDGLLSI